MKKNILVTGGAGFIGNHLCEELLRRGNSVVAFDNLSLGREGNIERLRTSENFTFIKGDILNKEEFQKLFDEHTFDVIFHLAANSDIAVSHKRPEIDFYNTFQTTFEVLNMAKQYDIKNIVFASTSAIYGDTNKLITEDFGPLKPVSHYGAAKLASEAFINSFSANYGIKVWIARFPNVIGEYATHGVIYDFINKLKKDPKELEVLGNGEQIKPYIYVKELVDALLFIWSNTDEQVNIFNVGVGSRTKVKEIAQMVIDGMGLPAKIRFTGGDRGWVGDVPEFNYDTSKINALGWKEKISSNEAVKKTIDNILALENYKK
jgi:UDP-glucose 4-epimerase